MNVSEIAQLVFDLMDQGAKERSPAEPCGQAKMADSVELAHDDAAGTPDDITLVNSLGWVKVAQAQSAGTSASAALTPAPAGSAPAKRKENASE